MLRCEYGGTAWHIRTVNLSALAGKQVSWAAVLADVNTPAGVWDILYGDIAITNPDGRVVSVFNRQPGSLSVWPWGTNPHVTQPSAMVDLASAGDYLVGSTTTTYYHGDQIGSARMTSAGSGWPVWSGTYTPFGVEVNAQITPNHYKFTGKERDSETGLDYFGARYYGSNMGRFMSVDPVTIKAERLLDPQRLNLYTYVRNNPLTYVDPDGRDIAIIENGPTKGNPIGHTAIAVTGQGVFSFGNNTKLGSSLSDYVSREAPRRDTTITIIKTTPEQDKAAVDALLKQDDKGGINKYPDNCAARSNAGLDAAGIPQAPGTINPAGPSIAPADNSMPGTAGERAGQLPADQVQTIQVPKGSTTVPDQLKQFEPNKNQDQRLPKPENKKDQSSS